MEKSLVSALRDVNLYRFLGNDKKEFVLIKQLLKPRNSIGAMIREAIHTERKTLIINH